ncbi:hypothetical protein M501DRAFT_932509 [Patellaria atrata CBS 101060]|uniref:Zn(2)-C6 fungal-type domain-containing protein n=1 Tax=Patellaria atrata CBS 101060 TaxID=1346257 RepID=A0A9P4SDL6_9PEZI|nr:hypothetical protein M501DRAFT_932509 [Patellaria atrata CBS 101060]
MSSISQPTVDTPAVEPAQPTTVPRKRRRRAPATGATEDCFTCRKRQTKCDRRRPYCSQCIDLGKECSGYRTTLTWGVGVASRGKLRGMSLPVPKSPSTTAETSDTKGTTAASRKRSPTAAPQSTKSQTKTEKVKSPSPGTSPPPMNSMSYDFFNSTTPIPIPSNHSHEPSWNFSGPEDHDGYGAPSKLRQQYLHPRPLQRLQTSLAASWDDTGLSASTGSLSTYSDSDYPSPADYPQTPDDCSYMESFPGQFGEPYLNPPRMIGSTESFIFHGVPRSYPIACDDMSSSISSDQSIHDFVEVSSVQQPVTYGPASYQDGYYNSNVGIAQPSVHTIPSEEMTYQAHGSSSSLLNPPSSSSSSSSSIPRSLQPTHFYHLPPRMQYLLDYYDKAICPVLVAFDGPSNPYRMHVMHLAMRSESLQNAIAALATNNIRMRATHGSKRIEFSSDSHLSSEHAAEAFKDIQKKPTAEELTYKSTSVELLNAQLADRDQAKHDSVLATLLILCLFHVCDSGYSKLQTQLAGVQKLLSMREGTIPSGFVGWIIMFFTWFDTLSAPVNDRETQIRSDCVDIMDFTANLGALEHLAGCEGRLFKLIARLGRLNLLSQNRPVRDQGLEKTPRASPQPKRAARDYYSLHFDHLDGNGWGSPVSGSPPKTSTIRAALPHASGPLGISDPDIRHEFWAEWREIRSKLQEWELDPSDKTAVNNPTSHPQATTQPAQSDADLLHISESFRYSALLYTERLAYPGIAPSSPNLQRFVTSALFHISQIGITSCVNKFLLWPLFITGTECVSEEQRGIVRARCVEIQRESGFYNNLSGLEVLERVWTEDDARATGIEIKGEDNTKTISPSNNFTSDIGRCRQAFRWRKAMDRTDGEYILI